MRAIPLRRQSGVSLIEALLAAVLLAIGLLGTIGLQARAYSALSDAGLRAEATIAAEELLGVMSLDSAHLGDYVLAAGDEPGERLEAWYDKTLARIPGASITVSVDEGAAPDPSEVAIAISWQRKADAPRNRHEVRSFISGAL
ncbi:MAG: prepilin-type N-terminal cleavage/methylation domain-containing protein [Pseudomonadota bacterium]